MEYKCRGYKEVAEIMKTSFKKEVIFAARDAIKKSYDSGKLYTDLMFDKGEYLDIVEFCGLGKAINEEVMQTDIMYLNELYEAVQEGDIRMVFGRRYVYRKGEWVHDENAEVQTDEKTGKERIKKAGLFDRKLKKQSKEDEKREEEYKKTKTDEIKKSMRSLADPIDIPGVGSIPIPKTSYEKKMDGLIEKINRGETLSQKESEEIEKASETVAELKKVAQGAAKEFKKYRLTKDEIEIARKYSPETIEKKHPQEFASIKKKLGGESIEMADPRLFIFNKIKSHENQK